MLHFPGIVFQDKTLFQEATESMETAAEFCPELDIYPERTAAEVALEAVMDEL